MARGTLAVALAFGFIIWSAAAAGSAQDLFRSSGPPPEWESCEELHDTYVKRFEATDGMGVSRMYKLPMRDLAGVLDTGRVKLSLTRLELIGLLQQSAPVIYTPLTHTSRPDPARPGRELTPFETRALAEFRKGRDIAADAPDGEPTACAGAIRARAACLKCHDGAKAGDLLGAFSYGFTRARGGFRRDAQRP